jgi:hypothetical protein
LNSSDKKYCRVHFITNDGKLLSEYLPKKYCLTTPTCYYQYAQFVLGQYCLYPPITCRRSRTNYKPASTEKNCSSANVSIDLEEESLEEESLEEESLEEEQHYDKKAASLVK